MNWIIAGIVLTLISWISLACFDQEMEGRPSYADLALGLLTQGFGEICFFVGFKFLPFMQPYTHILIWVLPLIGLLCGWIVLFLFTKIKLSPTFVSHWSKFALFFFPWIPEKKAEKEDEEIEKLLDTSSIEDLEDQREVIENALDLGDTTLDQICTHRSNMVCLSMKDDPSKWRQVILNNRHTFYPITNDSGDDIVGVLDTRDYFRLNGFGKKTILEQTVDRPMFVAENTTADELIHIMKTRRNYIAIVLDEYGGVVGLVTLHDVIEELFGDLAEQEEKRQADTVKLPKGGWRINGEADLEDVSKALGVPLQLDDFETFSGYVLGSIGYIPEDGSQLEVTAGPLNVQIKRIKGHRIRQAVVKVNEPQTKEDTQTDENN